MVTLPGKEQRVAGPLINAFGSGLITMVVLVFAAQPAALTTDKVTL